MSLLPVTLFAFDVYFFKNTAGESVANVANVQKIVFSADGLSVTDANGALTNVPLADFDYFAFNKSASVADMVAETAPMVVLNGFTLNVSAAEGLSAVDVIAVNGATVYNVAASGANAVIDLSFLSTGVYTVRVTTASSVYIKKIFIAD